MNSDRKVTELIVDRVLFTTSANSAAPPQWEHRRIAEPGCGHSRCSFIVILHSSVEWVRRHSENGCLRRLEKPSGLKWEVSSYSLFQAEIYPFFNWESAKRWTTYSRRGQICKPFSAFAQSCIIFDSSHKPLTVLCSIKWRLYHALC